MKMLDLTSSVTHLQGQLSTIEHGTFERVFFVLQVGFSSLACSKKIFKNLGQESFADICLCFDESTSCGEEIARV